MRKCSKADIGVSVILLSFFSLSFSLLIIEDYFSLSDLPDVLMGLSGALIDNKSYSYSDLTTSCGPAHTLKDYCDNLEDLEKAGKVFQSFLILDILLIVFFALELVVLRVLLTKLVSQYRLHGSYNARQARLIKFVVWGRHAFFLHPVLLFAGVVLWAAVGKLADLKGSVNAESGLIISLLHCFCGLIAVAGYGYYIISSRRRNIVMMIDNQMPKKDPRIGEVVNIKRAKIENESIELFDGVCLELV